MRLSHLPSIAQLVSGKAGIQSRICLCHHCPSLPQLASTDPSWGIFLVSKELRREPISSKEANKQTKQQKQTFQISPIVYCTTFMCTLTCVLPWFLQVSYLLLHRSFWAMYYILKTIFCWIEHFTQETSGNIDGQLVAQRTHSFGSVLFIVLSLTLVLEYSSKTNSMHSWISRFP